VAVNAADATVGAVYELPGGFNPYLVSVEGSNGQALGAVSDLHWHIKAVSES
jgi:hypothetical protein